MILSLLEDKIAVVPIGADRERVGSIFIPESAKKSRTTQGIVKYRGPDTKDIRVGDHVLFGAYVGTKLNSVDEGELIIMREGSVDAIILGATEDRLLSLSQINQILDGLDWNRDDFAAMMVVLTLSNFDF